MLPNDRRRGDININASDYGIDCKKAVLNEGNLHRIKRVMKQASRSEDVVIGFLGGSITQGCLSSTPETCYAYLVYKWWCEKFPNANIRYVNAGIGGTTSQFGVARVEDDLHAYAVDISFLETVYGTYNSQDDGDDICNDIDVNNVTSVSAMK